jgi:hypothetical protein
MAKQRLSRDPVEHPFEIGERYTNRNGECEVMSIDEPRMLIRYISGTKEGLTHEVDVQLQARIWQNVQNEQRDPVLPAKGRARAR